MNMKMYREISGRQFVENVAGWLENKSKELLAAPLSLKAQAIKVDQKERKRALDRTSRKGKQVSPSTFTRYLEVIHAKHEYEGIAAVPFMTERDDMLARSVDRRYEQANRRRPSGRTGHTCKSFRLTSSCVPTYKQRGGIQSDA